MRLKAIARVFRYPIVYIIKILLFFIPKKRNLMVFSSWFGNNYSDNTMYLYEYLLKSKEYCVMWLTRNLDVYEELKNNGKPVRMLNSISGLWYQIRAKYLFSTIQLNDFNRYFLSNCIYIDLDHGIPFKRAGYDIDKANSAKDERLDNLFKKFVHYYSTATSYLSALMIRQSYHTPMNKILLCGKPREDLFFNKELQKGLNDSLRKIIGARRAITYMPTHRKCGDIKIDLFKILDLDFLDSFCEENNCVFIIKKHYYHSKEETDLSRFKNIFDLTQEKSINSQMLLAQTDVLISDYSSVCTEYLLLDRPLILYTYDIDWYKTVERGLFLPIECAIFGLQVNTAEELNHALSSIVLQGDLSEPKRKMAKEIYYDESIDYSCSSRQIIKLIKKESLNQYNQDWSSQIEEVASNKYLKGIEELLVNESIGYNC